MNRPHSGRKASALVLAGALVGWLAAVPVPAAGASPVGSRDTAKAPAHLTIDDRTTPLDVTGSPNFGWLPQDSAGNEIQTAYDISVSNALTGAPAWDSGKVVSSDQSYVPYSGPALADGAEYAWQVITWNREGQQSPPARSSFDTGINDNEWSGAQWIRRATTGNDSTIDYTLARKQVTLKSLADPVTRARVYVAAPMRWQLHVNGTVVDTQDDYQTAGENYYAVENITRQAVATQQARGSAAGQLAIGVQYAHWAAGEAHPEGPQPYSSTITAEAPLGATTITVAPGTASTCASAPTLSAAFCGANDDWYVGESLGFGTVGTPSFATDTIAGISGNMVTLAMPLAVDEASGTPVTSENGPSGLLAKVVVDYADGTSATIVSDGNWMVTKDTAEVNTTAKVRSTQSAGDYVEYYSAPAAGTLAGWDTVGHIPTADWQAPVIMGKAPLPNPPDCGNYSTSNGRNTAPTPPATATGTPVLSSPCGFTHLKALQAPVTYKIVHPKSVTTLSDGTVEADFGYAFVAAPVVQFPSSGPDRAGAQTTITASYRLAGTVTTAAVPSGATSVPVDNSASYPDFAATGANTGFAVGDPVTIDAPADGYGTGHPETDTITSISGGTIGLATPLTQSHASGVWVQGSRVGTGALDTQSTNLNFYYTQSGTPGETTDFYVPMGWRYLQIDQGQAANGGQPLTPSDVWAVEQYNAAAQVGSGVNDPGEVTSGPDSAANVHAYQDTPASWIPTSVFSDAPASAVDEATTFTSSNKGLDSVFNLLERSALFSGQQAYEDSPDRQEGQFTGDGVDESLVGLENLNERALTREFIDNLISSQQRWWIAGSPAQASTWGEVNAIYPDNLGDNKRDIPDYSEMFPELVWDYYLATGDKATLAAAYPTMQNVAQYVADNTSSSGQVSNLVCQLASFSTSKSYRFGIIDWSPIDRYNTAVINSGVDTVVNMRAVEDYRALAGAAQVLGDQTRSAAYTSDMTALIDAINTKLVDANGLYDDGMTVAGGSQGTGGDCSATTGDALIGNDSQHDQTFAIAYGVAPPSSYSQLGAYIASQGMKQGPMDLGQLELALVEANQPAALVDLLTNTAGDGPAKILAEGGTSLWEQWDPGCGAAGGQPGDNVTYNDVECSGGAISQTSTESFSHGWGSVGAYPMTRGLLGITPGGVGAATVNVEPPSAGLASARGTEWTERGPVSVNWRQQAHGRATGEDHLTVTVPDNVQATVSLPAGAVPYRAHGQGGARYIGTSQGKATFIVGSGVTTFAP